MYSIVLALHSLVRWLVLASLVFAIYRCCKGWFTNAVFTGFDNRVRHVTVTIVHVQLLLGLWLYAVSPVIDYFLHHYATAVHQREIRFFGMEHNLMMLGAIILITIGSTKAKRATSNKAKFKMMAIWFAIALLIILVNIPWAFSPFAGRPNFRSF
jgi:hypothetical protein